MSDPYRATTLTNQAAYDEIQKILAMLPDEDARKFILCVLLTDRCRACLEHAPEHEPGCRYDARGG